MIRLTHCAGRRIAVFGLGLSGLATCRALAAGGADVAAWDDGPAARQTAQQAGLHLVDLSRAQWEAFATLVLAPGVPLTHPAPHWTVAKAKAAGVEIIGDIELFCRERAQLSPQAPLIAITGTNGKSTTTALIAHILTRAGKDVQMGGNIGRAILALEPPAQHRIHVIEVSSFQIELAPSLAPSIGVLLNISPDHLDRHGTMAAYAALKTRLVTAAQRPVVGRDDAWCSRICDGLRLANAQWVDAFSARTCLADGWFAQDTRLISRAPWTGPLGGFADIAGIATLRGRHNVHNALAASAASLIAGAAAGDVAAGLGTFPGLPHRLEEIGHIGGVLFVNDSKATNVDSTATALAAFPDGIFLILGGKPKEGGIAGLEPYYSRIAKAYLIGTAMEDFAATLAGKVAFERAGRLDMAVAAAARDAATAAGGVVLLSPACASYDQFANFEQRGEAFRQLVAALPGIALRKQAQA
jgi:UDP-N-acetylmuramoylalanine--D-glutamate ligase